MGYWVLGNAKIGSKVGFCGSLAPTLLHKLKLPHSYLWYVGTVDLTHYIVSDRPRSPALLPKPDDWPENIDICGFQFFIP